MGGGGRLLECENAPPVLVNPGCLQEGLRYLLRPLCAIFYMYAIFMFRNLFVCVSG